MMVWLLFILLSFSYAFISVNLFMEHQYIHSNLIFFGEKALIATQKALRLENIGFVYPPIAFVPFLLYNDPLVVPAIVSALMSALLVWYILKTNKGETYSFMALPLLLFNSLYVFLASQRFEVLIFYLLIAFSALYALRHMREGYSIHIFLAGIMFGMTFFVDFRSILLIPIYVLSIFLSVEKRGLSYRLAIIVVKLTPIVFFFLSWLYLNWIFTGSPFYFIESPYSFFRSEPIPEEVRLASGSVFSSLILTSKYLLLNLPLILTYFILPFYMKRYYFLYSIPIFLIYLIPAFLLYFSIYFGLYFPYMHTSVLFLIFSLVFAYYMGFASSRLFIFLMFISYLVSFFMPFYSRDLNEKAFIASLWGKGIPKVLSLGEEIKTADLLKERVCSQVLSDDAYTFRVVYFTEDSSIFMLPHNYAYYTALSNPSLFVDCILISRHEMDLLSRRFPRAQQGFLPGFYLIHEGEKYMLYLRQEGFNASK